MNAAPPRIAVIGAGYWGANLVRVAFELGALCAVCEADPGNLERARALYPGVPMHRDYDDILTNPSIDAVILAVPAPAHADFALRAIAAGKDVFVEKPLALTTADAEAIVTAADRAGRKVFVGHVLLYHPALQALLAAIESGAIGDVRHVRSRRLSWGKLREHENVWWSFAPHDVALLDSIMGGHVPAGVRAAQSAYVRPGIADFAYADYRYADGRSAHIEVSWLDPDKTARLDVFGSTGTLTFTDSRQGATLRLTHAGTKTNAGTIELTRGETTDVPFTPAEPLTAEVRAFIDWIATGVTPPTDGRQGRNVVRILELTQAAAQSQEELPV